MCGGRNLSGSKQRFRALLLSLKSVKKEIILTEGEGSCLGEEAEDNEGEEDDTWNIIQQFMS